MGSCLSAAFCVIVSYEYDVFLIRLEAGGIWEPSLNFGPSCVEKYIASCHKVMKYKHCTL